MTAPIVTHSLNSLPVDALPGYRFPFPIASRTPRSANKGIANRRPLSSRPNRDRFSPSLINHHPELPHLWSRLLEILPQGVIIVSRTLKPMYWNQKAKKLCQVLAGDGLHENALPLAVTEACYSVLRDNPLTPSSLMMECQTSTGHFIRVSTQILEFASIDADTPDLPSAAPNSPSQPVPAVIAVLLENCDEILHQEAWIQQQKYDLTDRETEIWMLLRQELTYQEIAQTLQISLNTVKTHVKNVYAKRRSCQGKEKFWC